MKYLVEEVGGVMLNITGMNRFCYLRNFHDMRCKYARVLSVIHQQLNRESEEDEVFYKYSCQQVSYILEHKYQVVCYKLPDGKIRESYLSKDGSPDCMDVVPGTHASADFLAYASTKFLYAYE